VIAQSEPSVFSLFRRAQQRSPIHGWPVTVIAWNEALARPLGRRKLRLAQDGRERDGVPSAPSFRSPSFRRARGDSVGV
jgi:hypothetical protein